MFGINSLIYGILIFLVIVTNVTSLKCYSCSLCNDPFDERRAEIVQCKGACLKGKTGDNTARLCSVINTGETCEEKDGTAACSCTSDLCNKSPGSSVSVPVVCLSIIILFLHMC